MPEPPQSLHGPITLLSALDDDDNVLQRLTYPHQRQKFFDNLLSQRSEIEAVVSYHLGLAKANSCRMGESDEWMAGSFNVCVPIYVEEWACRPKNRVLIRFPLPYKLGESHSPGNTDEKLRCEVATFVWMQEHCPTVPIPHLFGFGFRGEQGFTTPENTSLYDRLTWTLRRNILPLFGVPRPCRYISRRCSHTLGLGYLVMEYIEKTDGRILSETWGQFYVDHNRRANLFRDISRIILSLAQFPQPRIGSWTIDDRGILSLTNRPLTLRLQDLENEGILTDIDKNLTYSTTETYLLDLLACHDKRIRSQPNSVRDKGDGQAQMAALTMMRAVLTHFIRRDLRGGPFFAQLTDMSWHNLIVDENWNIKCVLDLEWTCVRPADMLHPPSWLTGRGVDQLEGEHYDAYCCAYKDFLTAFEEQERLLPPVNGDTSYRTGIMRSGWKVGNFWYFQALDNPKGLYSIFLQHIQPKYDLSCEEETFDMVVSPYWSPDGGDVLDKKVKDKQAYDNELRLAFEDTPRFRS